MKIPSFSKNQNDDYYSESLSKTLQTGLSDNGWTLPQQTTTNITTLSDNMPNGTQWYDSETHEFKVKIDGTVKTVSVS
jgi:hypothetical protein